MLSCSVAHSKAVACSGCTYLPINSLTIRVCKRGNLAALPKAKGAVSPPLFALLIFHLNAMLEDVSASNMQLETTEPTQSRSLAAGSVTMSDVT